MSGETKGSDGHVKTVDRQVQLAAEADVDSEQVCAHPIRLHSQAHLVPSWKGEEESIITHPMQVLVSHEDEVLKIFIPRRQKVVHGKLRREKKSMS